MLKQQLANDLKTAMKSGDRETLGVLRMIIAALGNKSIDKRGKGLAEELTDEEVLDLVKKELKKRMDAADLYQKGGRPELAAKEEAEARIIKKYLPEQMSREEVEKKIDEILLPPALRGDQNDGKKLDIGSAMKLVMAELKGKTDAKIISDIVKGKIK